MRQLPIPVGTFCAAIMVLIGVVPGASAAELQIPQEPNITWLSRDTVSAGPALYNNKIAYASENTFVFLNKDGTEHRRIPVGNTITIPIKRTYVNETEALSFATPSRGYVVTEDGIQYKVRHPNRTIYTPPLLFNTSQGQRVALSLNFPHVSAVNGTTIWERSQHESRFLRLLDMNGDNTPELLGGVSQLFALTAQGNMHWNFNISIAQPPLLLQLDSDAKQEIVAFGPQKIQAFDTDGSKLWSYQANNVERQRPVATVQNDAILVATQDRIIRLDTAGKVLNIRNTTLAYPNNILPGRISDTNTGYVLSDDSTVVAFTANTTLWDLTFTSPLHQMQAVDITGDGTNEIIVGTGEGIAVIETTQRTLRPVVRIEQKPVRAGSRIQFSAARSEPTHTEFRWDVNNDSIFETDWQQTPTYTHRYFGPGNYTVALALRYGDRTAQTYKTISVLPQDTQPVVNLSVTPLGANQYQFIARHEARGHTNLSFRFDIDEDGTYERQWDSQPTFTTRLSGSGSADAQVEVKTTDSIRVSDTATYTYSIPATNQPDSPQDRGGLNTLWIIGSIVLISAILLAIIFYRMQQLRHNEN